MTARPPLNVFVSYRREDTRHLAGRLYDRLADSFGSGQVFMDVDSIKPGSDFHREIGRAVGRSDVVLALIGPRWVSATDAGGRQRLDDPADLVRTEICAALEHDVRLVPVLVDGARMPVDDELPPALRPLARRQAVRLEHTSFRGDVENLISAISPAPGGSSPGPTTAPLPVVTGAMHAPVPPSFPVDPTPSWAGRPVAEPPSRSRRRRGLLFALGAVVVLAVALAAWLSRPAQVAVPELAGATVLEAGSRLTAAGLVQGAVATSAVDDPTLLGKVVGQDPPASREVDIGSTVALTVGGPPDAFVLPTAESVPPPSLAPTTTARPTPRPQNPKPTPKPTPTPTPTPTADVDPEMPDVTGDRLRDAQRKLQQAGIAAVSVQPQVVTDEEENGRVLDQSPAPGTSVNPDDTVVLIVGQLPPAG